MICAVDPTLMHSAMMIRTVLVLVVRTALGTLARMVMVADALCFQKEQTGQ